MLNNKISPSLKSQGLGVFTHNNTVFLFTKVTNADNVHIVVDSSTDGYHFTTLENTLTFTDLDRRSFYIDECSDFRISVIDKEKYILLYQLKNKPHAKTFFAQSINLVNWQNVSCIPLVKETAILVPEYSYRNKYVLYYSSSNSLKIAFSKDLNKWQTIKSSLYTVNDIDNPILGIKLGQAIVTNEGILVIYFVKIDEHEYEIRSILFDKYNPTSLIHQWEENIWRYDKNQQENQGIEPIGVTYYRRRIISYWQVADDIYAVVHKSHLHDKTQITSFNVILNRIKHNPILKPIVKHFWESKAVFNAAAIYDEGKVHLVYRAIGDNDLSVLGYASSSDGIHIDDRSDKPIYYPSKHFEVNVNNNYYSPYMSGGGGNGGSEDPRLTRIGNRYYMTYVAYDGASPPRVALTSIDRSDFLNKKWHWETPVLISPPGVVDKNACLLSEKVKGKFVFFHRIFPNILIDFVDDLNFDGKTKFLQGEYSIKPRADLWDSRKIGVGAPPLKTSEGWLLIYHAVGEQDPIRYKIGVMLLDSNDPTKVLYRTDSPILTPEKLYENEGLKYGVIYPCGAVVIKNKLIVYYGGADMVLCVATCKLPQFIENLKHHQVPVMNKISVNQPRQMYA